MNRNPTRRRKRRQAGWLKGQLSRRPLPLWAVVTADVLTFAVSLLVFAYFHHVRPVAEKSTGLVSRRVASSNAGYEARTPDNSAVPAEGGVRAEPSTVSVATKGGAVDGAGGSEAAPAATAAPRVVEHLDPGSLPADDVGVFARRFAEKFTTGEVVANADGYEGPYLNIDFSRREENNIVFYVADIYVRDIRCIQTAFAKDKFGRGNWEWLEDICDRKGCVMGINGDYYGGRSDGIVVRNGELYRDDRHAWRDVCALYWDGTMKVYDAEDWDSKRAINDGCYQAWNFGPSLLDASGQALESFDSEVTGKNPRSAIGYFEPGHYCLVVVDGRQKRSSGMTLPELSRLMQSLGCACAYNLDGGESAEMVVNGETVSRPSDGGRRNSDAILIMAG